MEKREGADVHLVTTQKAPKKLLQDEKSLAFKKKIDLIL